MLFFFSQPTEEEIKDVSLDKHMLFVDKVLVSVQLQHVRMFLGCPSLCPALMQDKPQCLVLMAVMVGLLAVAEDASSPPPACFILSLETCV